MNTHHVVVVALCWIAFALFLAIMYSMIREGDKIDEWKAVIVRELHYKFNVREQTAWDMVEEAYPTRKAMYIIGQLNPRIAAARLFWKSADEGCWMPAHFNDSKLPEFLYFHPSWGGFVVEA